MIGGSHLSWIERISIVKRDHILFDNFGIRVILNRDSRVEKRLTLTTKLMLDFRKRAVLMRDALEVIFLDHLRDVKKGVVGRKIDSAAQHVDENSNCVLDSRNR